MLWLRLLRMLENMKQVACYMGVYTRSGDRGLTSLYSGSRVAKSNPLIEAIGAVDELSAYIGLVACKLKTNDKNKTMLINVQKDLYQIMAVLAGAKMSIVGLNKKVKLFEQKIDKIMSSLPKINSFILAGGTMLSSWFHILRTVCRRAERKVAGFKQPAVIKYLNRLSDLLFAFSRWYGRN